MKFSFNLKQWFLVHENYSTFPHQLLHYAKKSSYLMIIAWLTVRNNALKSDK